VSIFKIYHWGISALHGSSNHRWSPLLRSSGHYQQKLETSQPPICAAPRKTNNADNDPHNNNNNNNNNRTSFRRCQPWPFQAVVRVFLDFLLSVQQTNTVVSFPLVLAAVLAPQCVKIRRSAPRRRAPTTSSGDCDSRLHSFIPMSFLSKVSAHLSFECFLRTRCSILWLYRPSLSRTEGPTS
jgi:hypothetical protein